jgi:CRP/FNR family transcriptional regulator, cyclic AMP receptor protein
LQLEEGRGHVGWLVGDDDLLRPWEMTDISLLRTVTWRVLRPTRIALLDEDFARRAGAVPRVAGELLSRSARTAHWLLTKSMIVSCPVLEDRLMLLFALLGERWGRVTPRAIRLDLPLTHSLLATLCGARRPSVTLALGALQADGVVTRADNGGWLLQGVGPGLANGHGSCQQSYARALGLERRLESVAPAATGAGQRSS